MADYFGVPSLISETPLISTLIGMNRYDLFLPRLLKDNKNGMKMKLKEYFTPDYISIQTNVEKSFKNKGLALIENTDEETLVTTETLRQLQFSHVDNPLNEPPPDYNHKYVDFYFDVLVDDEISDKTLCKYDPINEKKGIFADERETLCRDVLSEDERKIFDIYNDESDFAEEVC